MIKALNFFKLGTIIDDLDQDLSEALDPDEKEEIREAIASLQDRHVERKGK